MARNIVGLTSIHVGKPLAKGVLDPNATAEVKTWKKITQPYQGGIQTNFTLPSSTEFFRENEADPFYSATDGSTATKKLTWEVADWDDNTLKFYFGENEIVSGQLYEGVMGFAFDAKDGVSMVFSRLKYVAIPTGNLASSEPLRISVEATVLGPNEGGAAWYPMATPEYTGGDYIVGEE
jgi:hypothetical protein